MIDYVINVLGAVWLFMLLAPAMLYLLGYTLRFITRKDLTHYKLGFSYMRLFKKEGDIYHVNSRWYTNGDVKEDAFGMHLAILLTSLILFILIVVCMLEPIIFKVLALSGMVVLACHALRFLNDIRVYINKSDIANKKD